MGYGITLRAILWEGKKIKMWIYFFAWLKWVLKGKPMVHYNGFHCGVCGKWVNDPFEIPEYRSVGGWWDTWGLCEECRDAFIY